jgi:hypothetical protein
MTVLLIICAVSIFELKVGHDYAELFSDIEFDVLLLANLKFILYDFYITFFNRSTPNSF